MKPLRGLIRRFAGNRDGTIAIIGALVLPAAVGMMAIGVEASMWRARQVKLTTVTDAVAYSSALLRKDGVGLDTVRQRARAQAILAGFPADTVTVDVDFDAAGKTNVRISEKQQRYFSLVFGNADIDIAKSAVAEATAGSSACLVALNQTGPALSFGGNGQVRLRNCVAASNSRATNSIYRFGSASLDMECLVTVGGIQGVNPDQTACEAEQTGIAPIADPLAFVATPQVSGTCSATVSGARKNSVKTFSPGRCSASDFSGTVRLKPGTYVFSSDLKLNSGTEVTGDGVTLVFEKNASLSINGHARVELTAPKTGPLKDILLFGRDSDGFTHNGTADVALSGIIYFPSSDVKINGNATSVASCTRIIGGSIAYKGSSFFDSTCVGGGEGQSDLVVNRSAWITD